MDKIALLSVFMSAVFNATIGVFSKLSGLPPEMITISRLFFGALFVLILIFFTNKGGVLWQWPTFPVLLNGVFISGFMFFYVEAMNYTTMTNAIMLVYMAPVTASILAHFVLKERLNSLSAFLIAITMLGFAMIIEFRLSISHSSQEAIGIGYGMLALLSYSGFIVLNRIIKPQVPVHTRTFWQLLIGSFVLLPVSISSIANLHFSQLPWLLAIGLIPGFLGIFTAVFALSRLSAAVYGTISYFEPVTVVFLGWTIFGEMLNFMQVIGCLFILAAGILMPLVPAIIENRSHETHVSPTGS